MNRRFTLCWCQGRLLPSNYTQVLSRHDVGSSQLPRYPPCVVLPRANRLNRAFATTATSVQVIRSFSSYPLINAWRAGSASTGRTKVRNGEIGEWLHVPVKTVEIHLTSLYQKLGIQLRTEAITFALVMPLSIVLTSVAMLGARWYCLRLPRLSIVTPLARWPMLHSQGRCD